jgi:hypothetical protein
MTIKIQRKIDRAAVAKSLRELELLFGKKTPTTKDNTQRGLGAGNTSKLSRREVPR